MSQAQNAALLSLLATVLFGAFLAAFWARRTLGLAPLFMVLGINEGFKYYSAATVVLRLYGVDIGLSSAVFFTASLTMVLVLYAREGVNAVRPVAWCIVACALLSGLVNELLATLAMLPSQPQTANDSLWRQLVGTLLLFLDIVGAIVLTARWRRMLNLWPAMFFACVVIVTLDTFAYNLLTSATSSIGRWGVDTLIKIAFIALFFAMAWAYFRWIEEYTFGNVDDEFDGLSRNDQTFDLLSALTLRRNSEQLFRDAYLDELTGSYNRRFLINWFPKQAKIDANRDLHTGLLLIDVDHFKQVNDRYGHAVGDVVLKHIVARMRARVRRGDAVVRWGGEEFIIVMPAVEANELQAAAVSLCELIAQSPLFLADEQSLTVTVTIGTALSGDSEGQELPKLLETADQRLYFGKRSGRNRVISATSDLLKAA
jgi:diguanylate cyclase (GGDEF)-like protein